MDILGVLDFAGVLARPDRGGQKTADISLLAIVPDALSSSSLSQCTSVVRVPSLCTVLSTLPKIAFTWNQL